MLCFKHSMGLLVLLAPGVLLMAGCLPLSVSPLYTGQDDAVYDESLLGVWAPAPRDAVSDAAGERQGDAFQPDMTKITLRWVFAPGEQDKRYRVTMADDEGRLAHFDAVLMRVGDREFLDLYPHGNDQDVLHPWLVMQMPPMHSFLRLERRGPDTFALAFLDMNALVELLRDQPEVIAHTWGRQVQWAEAGEKAEVGYPILTAEPAALQAFVTEHLDDAHYFGEWLKYERVAQDAEGAAAE